MFAPLEHKFRQGNSTVRDEYDLIQANVGGDDEQTDHAWLWYRIWLLASKAGKSNAHKPPSAEPATEKAVCRVPTGVGDVNQDFSQYPPRSPA